MEMDKVKLVQAIGNEVCEDCGTIVDCGLIPQKCSRIINAIALVEKAVKGGNMRYYETTPEKLECPYIIKGRGLSAGEFLYIEGDWYKGKVIPESLALWVKEKIEDEENLKKEIKELQKIMLAVKKAMEGEK